MVNTEPFNNYDLNEMFGVSLSEVVGIVNRFHNCVIVNVA